LKIESFNRLYNAEQPLLHQVFTTMGGGHPGVLIDDFVDKGGVLLYDGSNGRGVTFYGVNKEFSA
jgi:hypothetical protein